MAIAAAIKGNGTIAAARTLIAMSSQRHGAAACDGLEHFTVAPVNPAATVVDEAITLRANDVGHLQGWPGHFFSRLRECLTRSRLESWSESSGLGVACRCFGDRCR